ncbi:MAG: hypothetical protein JJT89_05440 [Nitriliruptoraceae bacterium]|nr:hypothetical protein [Nitriliruptoraceae bacterium]
MDTVEGAPASRRSGRRRLLLGGIVVAALVGVWFLTTPDDIPGPGGTVGMQLEPGESSFVGVYGLSGRDLVLESVEPVTLNGLDTALWLCDPIPESGVIGAGGRASLDEHCRSVEPFEPGTVLAGRGQDGHLDQPYLLVEVTSTSDQRQGMCGLDITYRAVDGWRTGRVREGGEIRVSVNEPEEDWFDEPEDELFAACRS